jgi:predicted NBD/HSP70 family sugar kinase
VLCWNRVDAGEVIGVVDIGGTKIAVGAVDGNGRVLAKAECPTEVTRGFDHAVQRVIETLAQSASKSGVKLQGIGIGCTGPVDPLTGGHAAGQDSAKREEVVGVAGAESGRVSGGQALRRASELYVLALATPALAKLLMLDS